MVRRWAWNIIAAVGALLCIATLWLWDRSYSTYDSLIKWSNLTRTEAVSLEGYCALQTDSNFWFTSPAVVAALPKGWHHATAWSLHVQRYTGGVEWESPAGFLNHFELETHVRGWDIHSPRNFMNVEIVVPYGPIALLFLLIAMNPLIRNRLRKIRTISGDTRRRVRKTRRLLVISFATVAIVLPITILVARYNVSEAWDAVWNTPMIYLLFITTPIAGVMLAFSTLQLQRGRLTLRKKRHLCKQCGYNLTGNTSGACPECGASIERKTDVPSLPSAPG